jgi:hypothetical protein
MKTKSVYTPGSSVVEDVQAKITELMEEKARQLDEAARQLEAARAEAAEAEAAGKAATEQMDYTSFALAEAQQTKAEQKARMYAARVDQIYRKQMVTEAESDAVIDRLREYLADLDAAFDADLSGVLKTLDGMYWTYIEGIQSAEDAILSWTQNVHPNYRSWGTLYVDPETGNRTNRNRYPVSVPTTNGQGGPSARMVRHFLSNFPSLLAAAGEDGEA